MTNAYTAGAVTAKITLDTKNFVTNIEDLQSRIKVLKTHLNEVGSFNDISKKVKELEGELSKSKNTFTKLNEKIADYKKQMNTLREENRNLVNQVNELNKSLKTNQTTLDGAAKARKSNAEAIKSEEKAHSENIKLINKEIEVNKKLTAEQKKAETQAKKTTQSLGTIGRLSIGKSNKNTTKWNKSEISLLKEMYDHFDYKKGFGDTVAPFAQNYKFFEEGYKDLFTKLDTTNPKLRNRIKKQFQKKFKDLSNVLGVDLIPGAFEGVLAEGTPKYTNFLGKRIGSYDLTNLISEKEFKSLIGETEELGHKFGTVKNRLRETSAEATKLSNEVSKLGSNKGVDEVTIDVKKLGEAEVKTTRETAKLSNELSKIKQRTGQLNNKNTSFKSIENNLTSTRKVANEEKKASEIIAESTKKNIQNKTKEAQAFKKYNEYEVRMLQHLQTLFKYNTTDKNGVLFPMDHFGNNGGRDSAWFNNYSSILRSNQRHNKLSGWNYKGDYTEFFQKRMKELLGDIGVTISDVTDNEFKKVKDKTTGKLVEYLDISKMGDNSWLKKVENQLWEVKNLERWLSDNRFRISNDSIYNLRDFKKQMDYRSKRQYELFGKEGNPYIKDYIKQNKLDEKYKLAQKRWDNTDRHSYYDFFFEKATKALDTFDRGLKTTTVDYDAIAKANEKFNASVQKTKQFLKDNDNGWNSNQQYLHKVSNALRTATNEYKKYNMEVARLSKGYKTYNQTSPINLNSYLGNIKQINQKTSVFDTTASQIQKASTALGTFNRMLKSTNVELELYGRSNLLGDISKNPFIQNAKQNLEILKTIQRRVKTTQVDVQGFQRIYDSMGKTFSTNNVNINNAKNVLKLFDGGVEKSQARLKAYELQTKATFETMQVELAKANAAQYKYWKQVRGTADVKGYNQLGTLDVGINQYYGQIDKINAKLAEFKRQQQSVNSNLNQTYSSFEKASQGVALLTQKMQQYETVINQVRTNSATLGNRIRALGAEITALSNKSTQNQIRLTNESRAVQSLGTRLKNLSNWYKQGKISATEYQEGISKLDVELQKLKKQFSSVKGSIDGANGSYTKANAEIRKLTEGYKQNEMAAKQSGVGVKQASNAMNGAAHSGRILSNTLYQIRGALLSLKMIFTAMGGMALWGFATDLAEGVKQTFTAKNEMEAQLRQNKLVNSGGIEYFNNQLDQLTDKFKKINKYSIGETVSAIGLEFELNSKQMAESLDIVSMIQSEYVRAGRKEDEAALAVKDILQGEFQRLSRETGVGKEELEKYGWNGKKTDIESLLKALRKAALDRNWDIFAAKATSLNDVMTITKSRFSEFGADLMQSATPMIVGAFNGIIGAIDSLKSSFNSMNPFWQNFTLIGGGTAIFGGLLTALPMITKGMGLADIATIGWSKSIATAMLNLNKAEVAQYGFRKALAATISGTKASELANVRASKAIFGRLLGVDQATLKEKSYLTAMVQSRAVMKGSNATMAKLTASTMSRSQKLAYLTTNIDLNTAKTLKQGQAIRKVATSWKIWRTAILGVMGIGLISWFTSVAAWTDKVKGYINGYQEVASTGKDLLKDAKKTVEDYTTSLSKLKKGTDEYAKAEANLEQAKANRKDIKEANRRVKIYKKQNKERKRDIKLEHQRQLASLYETAGKNPKAASELASGYTEKATIGQYYMNKALNIYNDRLYKASQHMKEHITQLKQAGVDEKARIRYIDEYNMESENAANLWKKFNKGDFNSGVYAVLSELKLAWIDISSRPEVVKLMQDLGKAFNDMKPTLKDISSKLESFILDLVKLVDWLSQNKELMKTLPWAALGGGILVAGKKLYNFLGGTKSTIDILKTLGGKLKDNAREWLGWSKKVKKSKKKAEVPETSTGGVTPEGKTTQPPTTRGEWWQNTKGQLYQDATKYTRAAAGIAAGMLLISEAILMMTVPMWSLAQTGKYFKSVEPQIRDGIDGLKLVSPIILTLLPPVIALSYIMDKYNVEFMTIVKGTGKAALGIAAGMLLVAEAILMIIPSIWALGRLGDQYTQIETQVQNGTRAMQVVGDSLKYLAPFIPMIIGGIALVALAFAAPEIGLPLLGATALGIAAGMLLVAEAIVTLNAPLEAIKEIGDRYPDISGVQRGAEAIKVTSEALGYVSDAMSYMTLIDLNLLAQNIDEIVSNWFGIDLGTKLSDLTGEGGVLDQLSDFVDKFNSDEFTITAPNPDKVTALASAGDGVKTIGDAMVKVKTAMDNLPDEFKNGGASVGNQLGLSGNNANGTAKPTTTSDSSNYFDAFKEPIRQLKDFIYDFNNSDDFAIEKIDPTRVENLSSSADMISTVNTAVEKVKTTMQGIGSSGHETAFATGGSLSAFGYDLYHMTGLGAVNNGSSSGNYKSSLGSQLQEMEDVIDDLFTFQSNISSKGEGSTGENDNISGATAMVTQIQDAISKISTSLSNAVPQFEGKGNAISQAIIKGINSGLNGVSAIGGSIVNKLANGIMTNKGTVYNTANSLGKTTATKFRTGVDPMNDYMTWEISYVKKALTERKEELGQDAYNLGHYIASRFKEGDDINSPGIMARSMSDEVGYIRDYLSVNDLPQMAYNLANNLSSNFKLDFGLSNIQLPNLTEFTNKLNVIPSTVANVKTQVSTNFTNMSTNVGTSLQGIANNAKTKYAQVVSNTRTSLANMKSATVKNIGNIKTSWRGMQDALIASADHIKTQTSSKINKLKTNLGEFWNKIKHPDQLISGAAGGKPTGTIRRRIPRIRHSGFAGSPLFKPKRSNSEPGDYFKEAMECQLRTGKPCYAGGWNFNWTNKIKDKFNGWDTHFNKYNLDSHLNVGKFNNSNFPVKGAVDVFKDYVQEVIAGTSYDFYFNEKYSTPADALRAGSFNCFDGTRVILALADAFGLGGGGMGHGTWGGTRHVWANIPGIGVIDPTAIQRGYGFKSPKVKGYGAGSRPRSYASKDSDDRKIVHNHGDTVVNINAPVYGVDDLENAIDRGIKKANRKLYTRSLSGV